MDCLEILLILVTITVNISDSNCDHESCVEDELPSNCDTKEKVDNETNSTCGTCLVEGESVRLGGKNSVSLDVMNHDHTCQPVSPENEFCYIDSIQNSLLDDMVSCSNSNKPSEFQKIWSILSDSLSYVVENMPTCIAYTLHRESKTKHCIMHPNVILLVETIMISIMAYNMD